MYQVYGPYQKFDRLIPHTIKNCIKNKKFDCTDGNQKRDFLYVGDFINLVEKILIKYKDIKTGVYNVGTGKSIKVRYLISKIKAIIKQGFPQFGKKNMRSDELMELYPSIDKLKNIIDWKPKVNLNSGIKKTILFYKKLKWIK